jgi:hypothetical protein
MSLPTIPIGIISIPIISSASDITTANSRASKPIGQVLKKLHPTVVVQIASSVWKTGSRDIRDVLKIAKLCNPADTEEEIIRLLSIHQKYRKTGNDYN